MGRPLAGVCAMKGSFLSPLPVASPAFPFSEEPSPCTRALLAGASSPAARSAPLLSRAPDDFTSCDRVASRASVGAQLVDEAAWVGRRFEPKTRCLVPCILCLGVWDIHRPRGNLESVALQGQLQVQQTLPLSPHSLTSGRVARALPALPSKGRASSRPQARPEARRPLSRL